jgi:hypothetical protein
MGKHMCKILENVKLKALMNEVKGNLSERTLSFLQNLEEDHFAALFYLVSIEHKSLDQAIETMEEVMAFRGNILDYARSIVHNEEWGPISPDLRSYVDMRKLASHLRDTHVEFRFLGQCWVANKSEECLECSLL